MAIRAEKKMMAEAGGGEGEDEAGRGMVRIAQWAEDQVGAGGGHAHEFDDEVGEACEDPDALGRCGG